MGSCRKWQGLLWHSMSRSHVCRFGGELSMCGRALWNFVVYNCSWCGLGLFSVCLWLLGALGQWCACLYWDFVSSPDVFRKCGGLFLQRGVLWRSHLSQWWGDGLFSVSIRLVVIHWLSLHPGILPDCKRLHWSCWAVSMPSWVCRFCPVSVWCPDWLCALSCRLLGSGR